jgi:hypothetical protein
MNKTLIIASMALALAACGGDGDDPPQPHPNLFPAEGLYRGKTSANQDITALVLDDGTYYVAYEGPPFSRGLLQGTMQANHGSFTSSDGKDFSVSFRDRFDVSLHGNYATRAHLNGTVRYPATGQSATFTSTYDRDYERTPTLATVAGTYDGEAVARGAVESVAMSISATGVIHGMGASACKFTGVVRPRSRGNVYDITVTYGPSPCARPGQHLRGNAYYRSDDRTLFATAINAERTEILLFDGLR